MHPVTHFTHFETNTKYVVSFKKIKICRNHKMGWVTKMQTKNEIQSTEWRYLTTLEWGFVPSCDLTNQRALFNSKVVTLIFKCCFEITFQGSCWNLGKGLVAFYTPLEGNRMSLIIGTNFKYCGPWWWSSGQHARLPLRRSEFESR